MISSKSQFVNLLSEGNEFSLSFNWGNWYLDLLNGSFG